MHNVKKSGGKSDHMNPEDMMACKGYGVVREVVIGGRVSPLAQCQSQNLTDKDRRDDMPASKDSPPSALEGERVKPSRRVRSERKARPGL